MTLEDKVAVITGGGRGIGKAVAIAYGRAGAKLALCARTASELEQTVTQLRALKTEVEGWICDVSLEQPVKQFVAGAHEKFRRIDVLVNNAGVMTRPVPMAELDVKKWDYTMAVNLRGPFLVTQAVLPIMMKQKSGSIINVSSMIGRGAYANFIAYATSKWGLEDSLRRLPSRRDRRTSGSIRSNPAMLQPSLLALTAANRTRSPTCSSTSPRTNPGASPEKC